MVRWCIRLTRLTLVCEVIRYRLVQVRQNHKKSFSLLWSPQASSCGRKETLHQVESRKKKIVTRICAHLSQLYIQPLCIALVYQLQFLFFGSFLETVWQRLLPVFVCLWVSGAKTPHLSCWGSWTLGKMARLQPSERGAVKKKPSIWCQRILLGLMQRRQSGSTTRKWCGFPGSPSGKYSKVSANRNHGNTHTNTSVSSLTVN